jgi:hypothetical protein
MCLLDLGMQILRHLGIPVDESIADIYISVHSTERSKVLTISSRYGLR